jgi:hypothetical protein
MHNVILLCLAALLATAIIAIGCFYVISPGRMTGSFGLKPRAPDADTRAWLRISIDEDSGYRSCGEERYGRC